MRKDRTGQDSIHIKYGKWRGGKKEERTGPQILGAATRVYDHQDHPVVLYTCHSCLYGYIRGRRDQSKAREGARARFVPASSPLSVAGKPGKDLWWK